MSKNQNNDKMEKAIENILTALWKFSLAWIEISRAALKKMPWKNPIFHLYLGSFTFLLFSLAYHYSHLKVLHWFMPGLFDYDVLGFLGNIPWTYHFSCMLFAEMAILTFVFGYRVVMEKRQYQNGLDLLSLGNVKTAPIVKEVIHKDDYRKHLRVFSPGIGPDRYVDKKNDLTSAFGEIVEVIKFGKNPKFVFMELTSRKLPEKCHYEEMQFSTKRPYSFVVGESLGGIENCEISKLPHMLIAGTTGGGKSVFFKQALLGILERSQYIQMYLLDLKGGVEMKDFTTLPNVRMAKNETQAVTYLEHIEREMKRRFQYLEQEGRKEINPEIDKMDKILVGIDEASVLYAHTKKEKGTQDLINRARAATDSIAKLGRAAGIHLILCTQKIVKEVIPTIIQDNITGRMCFRVPSLQGSMTVLGNRMAMDLPDIKGRGIWSVGNDFKQIQAPYISDEDILERLKDVKEKWKKKEFSTFQGMFEIKESQTMNAVFQE